tara:strand:+ start:5832 stop:6668 length:837 start_codon:yes stop_codon:yes gene_type:complete
MTKFGSHKILKGKEFILCLFFAFNLGSPSTLYAQSEYFHFGEDLEYTITYNWGFIWVDAGQVNFRVTETHAFNQPAIKFTGDGNTFSKYDWFYKVRDHYESITEPGTFKPYTFVRNVAEGNTKINNAYVFNQQKNLAYSSIMQENGTFIKDTIEVGEKTYDVISMIYLARKIPFEEYNKDDKIPISLILDNAVYDTYIRYLGKELVAIKGLKPIESYKFRPNLIDGTIFTGGEGMTVWVSADKNRVPLVVETPIVVGDIKAILTKTTNTLDKINYFDD